MRVRDGMRERFAALDGCVVLLEDIEHIDYSRLVESEMLFVWTKDSAQPRTVTGFLARELMWRLAPAALEGRVKGWHKHSWAVHNLFAHPLMQLLAFVGLGKLGVKLHDATVPKPL